MLRLVDGPIDVRELERAVAHPGAGAVLCFQGTTRDSFEGKGVLHLEYEAFAPMALAELERIAAEARARFPGSRLAVAHRVGRVEVGEASVVIAVSAPHRDEAYQASRFAIDALKARVPIWKKEWYADGSQWKANAESRGGDG